MLSLQRKAPANFQIDKEEAVQSHRKTRASRFMLLHLLPMFPSPDRQIRQEEMPCSFIELICQIHCSYRALIQLPHSSFPWHFGNIIPHPPAERSDDNSTGPAILALNPAFTELWPGGWSYLFVFLDSVKYGLDIEMAKLETGLVSQNSYKSNMFVS